MDDRVARAIAQWRIERPDLDVGPHGIIGRLRLLSDRLRDEFSAEQVHHGLDDGEFDVLATLRRAGDPYELAPGELARHTQVSMGVMSRLLDRLVEAGLVAWSGPTDARRDQVIGLTQAGHSVVDEVFTAHVTHEHRLVAALKPRERIELERLLTVWLAALEHPEISED
ncbi:MAG: MarR family transcriptional regulator [Aeromicrobium sp.]|uniref:MarR family winged helix-turn-helix transcriptional regulator n=1 Tax=Aeromicrobium sp. TaxID=1871063 RepID=UPI0039E69B98